jgi:Mlc titration factor MtfA (ptsG expression regulator)
MLFSWFKNRRRRKILAAPFPTLWHAVLRDEVGHYALLGENEQKKLRDVVQIMIAEKDWEGCRGLDLTDAMRVTIASLAAILVLGMDDYCFDNVATILVYPDAFVAREVHAISGGATVEEESDHLGEAHHRGPIILSWKETQENANSPGYGQNLVFHEFAHQLDMLNGAFDGTPSLASNDLAMRWSVIMDREFRQLQAAERRRRKSVLDPYGATNPAEFFAVAVECFFDSPRAMRNAYPDLYDLFRGYFRQDPAHWPLFEVG